MNSGAYHNSRLTYDARRETLWSALWRFHFSRLIRPEDAVPEFGAGYGRFINNSALQPNFRYARRGYFDDYTHVSVYTHVSLADFLSARGSEVVNVQPRFPRLTIKSRIPISAYLTWLYLRSPVKPFGKQMLIYAKPRELDGVASHAAEAPE